MDEETYNKFVFLKEQGYSLKEISEKLDIKMSKLRYYRNGNQRLGQAPIHKIPNDIFIELVKSSFSISECLKKQGLQAAGANYKGFHKRVKQLNLDTSHFTGQGHLKNRKHGWAKEKTVEETFVQDGGLSTLNLKKKILKYDLKPYLCDICGIKEWLDKPLSLHLDHINGVNIDNRLENLRFLCPNCHSQTDTYCGRSKGKYKIN